MLLGVGVRFPLLCVTSPISSDSELMIDVDDCVSCSCTGSEFVSMIADILSSDNGEANIEYLFNMVSVEIMLGLVD